VSPWLCILHQSIANPRSNSYSITKLMEVLILRELVECLSTTKFAHDPPVLMTLVNPGLCKSEIGRGNNKPKLGQKILWTMLRLVLERPTEIGGRVMVIAADGGVESHGMYQSDGKNQAVESWILSEMGEKVQKKVFEQTMRILETRRPGIGASVGL
jgi:retinol dehydrogenase-12